MSLDFIQKSQLPTRWGMFELHGFHDAAKDKEHIVLSLGPISGAGSVLVRIHSECLTGDSLFSLRCDCGSQLEEAMRLIAKEGRGAVLYLRQEGRGIGLLNKIKAYHLQDEGADTVEANEQLGFDPDMRDYSMCRSIFEHFEIDNVRLLTNNPKKVQALEEMGIVVSERIALQTGQNPHNEAYLAVKAGKLGHLFDKNKS